MKGKSAISIARNYMGWRKNLTGQNFWARGYYISTAGLNEQTTRKYIREQENKGRRLDRLELFKNV
jgi:putative transposase